MKNELLVLPHDPTWNQARLAWNLSADQQPAAVALPESAEDVQAVVRWARSRGLRIAPQGTGHNALPLGSLAHTVLLKTERMRGVEIDAQAERARVEAGVLWGEVTDAAAEHGLVALAGSSPDVGVVGYTLGGGMSWLGRRYGLGANNVSAIEVVTADARLRRVDRDHDPDLFWALRGGGGNFGIVTAIELDLFAVPEVYAGILWFPVDRAGEVLNEWRAWTDGLPDEATSVGRILQLPPVEAIPEPVRGKSFVVVELIHCGDEAEGRELIAPLRALGPVLDTVAWVPVESLTTLHMDPEQPVPGSGDGTMLDDLDEAAIDAIVCGTVGTPLLSVELRHLGGAFARNRPDHGAIASFAAPFALYAVGAASTPAAKRMVEETVAELRRALAPLESSHTYLNFCDTERDASTLWTETSRHRLRRIKAAVDPHDVIRSNHEL